MYGGVDLAAKVENETGVCVLDSDRINSIRTVFEDESIIHLVKGCSVIAVDAPLTDTRKPFREAERELMSEFGGMLPLNTSGMKKLCERAVMLKGVLESETDGIVIETYPRAVEKAMDVEEEEIDFESGHEYDAYLCALTAKNYDEGRYERYGKSGETIVIPSREK
ncbi:MAG: DUF429 domain-containing protein [Candidatus Natronoplasma sp.]